MSVREDAMLSDSVKTIVSSALRIARGMDNVADHYFLQINQTKQMASQIKHSLLKIILDRYFVAAIFIMLS